MTVLKASSAKGHMNFYMQTNHINLVHAKLKVEETQVVRDETHDSHLRVSRTNSGQGFGVDNMDA